MEEDCRRYHRIIEQQVDVFVTVCKDYIEKKNLSDKVWVIKDELQSVVGIGNPDKLMHSKDFGFAVYYEQIIGNMSEAVELFRFKVDHYIKVAQTTNKFSAFKNGKAQKQPDSENTER